MAKDDPKDEYGSESLRAPPAPGRRGGGEPERKAGGTSVGGFALALAVLTLLGAGTGVGLGLTLGEIRLPEPETAVAGEAEPRFGSEASLVRLRPVIANLAEPVETWVRLDAALVLDGVEPEAAQTLAAEITGDVLAYMRTLSLARLEGASGLAYLREDLTERARTRSEGRVREFVIETLVVQ